MNPRRFAGPGPLGAAVLVTLVALWGCSGSSSSRRGTIPPVAVETLSLPDATQGSPYSFTLTASGGAQPFIWSLAVGPLPAGLALSAAGVISGTPNVSGAFPITVQVIDSQPTPDLATAPLTLAVTPPSANRPVATWCTLAGTQRGQVDICYQLIDLDSDPVTISVEYSMDSGVSYLPATMGPGGATNSPFPATPAGISLLYQWDSMLDVPGQLITGTRLRITPDDGLPGAPDETADFTLDNSPGAGIFLPSDPMATARMLHTATLLSDGSVLVAGGTAAAQVVLATAEIYSPETGRFTTLTPIMTTPRTRHTATRLPNGTVLITGGKASVLSQELDSAEIFDPQAGTFQATGSMSERRTGHAAVSDGAQVIVAGGVHDPGPVYLAEAEVYDPASGTFQTPVGTTVVARAFHTATLLQNGRVLLVAGGDQIDLSAEEFDPGAGTSPVSNTLPGWSEVTMEAASLLPDGTVLITGGGDGRTIFSLQNSFNIACIYTSPTGLVPVGPLLDNRKQHTSTLLPDGRVLIAGGEEVWTFLGLTAVEFYDTNNPGFFATAPMSFGRMRHAAVLLNDGRVLMTGGTTDGNNPLVESERYHP